MHQCQVGESRVGIMPGNVTRRWLPFVATIAMLACSACNDLSAETADLTSEANGLIGESDTSTEASDVDNFAPDLDDPVLVAEWIESASAISTSASASSALNIDVTNVSDDAVSFVASMKFHGLLDKEPTKDMGSHTLISGATVNLSLPADSLPIRNLDGATQVYLVMTRIVQTNVGPRQVSETSSPRYYRHEAGYGSVISFDQQTFIDSNDGELLSVSVSLSPEGDLLSPAQTLGQVSDGAGGFTTVTSAENAYAVKDAFGDVIAYTTRISMGVEVMP